MKVLIQIAAILLATLAIESTVQAGTLQWCDSPNHCTTIASGSNAFATMSLLQPARRCDEDQDDNDSGDWATCMSYCSSEYRSCVANGDSESSCRAWRGICESNCRN